MKRTPLKRKTPMKRGGSTLKRTPLRKVSKKQAARNDLYGKQRKEFLAAHPQCAVCGGQATQVHHKAGRGARTNDVSTFIAVCARCHDWIHFGNPAAAREQGFLS